MYKGPEDPKIKKDLEALQKASVAFEKKHRGKLAKYNEKQLLDFYKELEKLVEKSYVIGCYAALEFYSDATNQKALSLMQKTELASTEVREHFIFVSLELAKREDLEKLAKSPKLKPYNINFEEIFRQKKHLLNHDQEEVLSRKSMTSSDGWDKLYNQNFSKTTAKFRGKEMNKEEIFQQLRSPDLATRKEAAKVYSEMLRKEYDLNTYIYNMLLLDKFQNDKMRKFTYPEEPRHLDNGVSEKTVKTMVDETLKGISSASRFYNIRKKLIGVKELAYYDRYAPLKLKGFKEPKFTFDQAVERVEKSFRNFDPEFADIFLDIVKSKHVDAEIRKGKHGGAFCMFTSKQIKPYILVNFFGSTRDVETLAHEGGHAIHDVLATNANPMSVSHAPLTMAEVASIFAEQIMFEDLLSKAKSKQEKIALISNQLDDIMASVYRQVVFYIFEQKAHRHLRETGELSGEQLKKFWMESQKLMFGNSVKLNEDYEVWWSYVSHFFNSPFYVYAYSFAHLLVLAIYRKYKEGEPGFVEKYKKFLAIGGTKTTTEAVKEFGFDLEDPEFWRGGIQTVEDMIADLESLVLK